MSIIEIDTDKDIDTYIISGDDIDLSHEGFIVKQKNYHDGII